MFVGYLTGLRGERLLDSDFAALVAADRSQLQSVLALASARRFRAIPKTGRGRRRVRLFQSPYRFRIGSTS